MYRIKNKIYWFFLVLFFRIVFKKKIPLNPSINFNSKDYQCDNGDWNKLNIL